MKISKRKLRRIIKEEKAKLQEGAMGQMWYECMDELFNMALNSNDGFVCCFCASKAMEMCGAGHSVDMETCCQLIQDCIDDGLLMAIPHPRMRSVTVYAAID